MVAWSARFALYMTMVVLGVLLAEEDTLGGFARWSERTAAIGGRDVGLVAERPRDCVRRRSCSDGERTIQGKRGKNRDSNTAVGGGFGLLAPWPAGKTLVVGGRCGYFFGRGPHRDWGGRWADDRFAVDIGVCGGADAGLPVLAAHTGRVRIVQSDPTYGNEVVIEAGDALDSIYPSRLTTRYSHLGKIGVKEGDLVLAGQRIGTIGHSGEGGGSRRNAHLHFAAYSGRGPRAGMRPEPLAGVLVCDGCRVTSLTQPPDPNRAPFLAALKSQFPMDDEAVVKGEARQRGAIRARHSF